LKKIIFYIALLLLALFIFSPAIGLNLSGKFREHVYSQLLMRVIALRESAGETSSSGIAKKLFFYTVRNTLLNPGDTIPYDGKALDYLTNGLVYCDYQADILASLCAPMNIPARYCMLRDKDGVSPHTVAEIEISGKWGVFDVAEACYYSNRSGDFASVEDLSNDPQLLFGNKRWQELKKHSPEGFDAKVAYYGRMFPSPMPPERSSSKMKRITVFDRICFVYYDIFRNLFFEPYQDYYLKMRTKDMDATARLYYYARNYQLAYRSNLATSLYNQLISSGHNTPYFNKSVIFLGLLYMDQSKDYNRAIKTFGLHINGLGSPYEKYALYYTGRCYQFLGNEAKAQEHLTKSGMVVMLDPQLAN